MMISPREKDRPFPPVSLPDRQWPNRVLSAPPIWCSVDLRDGNQSLIEPMGHDRLLESAPHCAPDATVPRNRRAPS